MIFFSFKVYGDLPGVPKSQQLQFGWILRGLDPESINQLRVDDPDLIATLGSTDFHLVPDKVITNLLFFKQTIDGVTGWIFWIFKIN